MKRAAILITPAILAALTLTPASAAAYHRYSYWQTSPRPSLTAPTATPVGGANVSPAEQTLIDRLNKERVLHGLRPLQVDTTLTAAARAKSQDMVSKNYFSHTSPTFGSPAQLLQKYGVRYTAYGENIAQGGSAVQIHQMWMNSPGHRANMLNGAFTHVGIGVVSGSGGLTATQEFITR